MYSLRRRGGSAELWDEAARLVASTAFRGDVAFATLDVECPLTGERYTAAPNRRVMPSSWLLEPRGAGSRTVFSRRIGEALANPFGRTLLSIDRQPASAEYQVVDARRGGIGRALNLERSDWALVRGEEPVARLGFLRRPDNASDGPVGGGLIGRARGLARALTYDRALVPLAGEAGASDGMPAAAHDLTAAEVLVLLLLVESLTANA